MMHALARAKHVPRACARRVPGAIAALAWVVLGASATAQGVRTSATERLAAHIQHREMLRVSPFGELSWQHLGPTNISGRATDVALVEPKGAAYTIYVAGASGGVWRTDNEGVTWTSLFDDQVTTSIGDIAIAPSDPRQVWVGTGEANLFRSSHAGAGIYKSTDRGDTWAHTGLEETQTIARVVVHPSDPDIVWVAASGHGYTDNPERGIYKTTDGGRSWRRVLFVDAMTGAIDLVVHPTDPEILYAATWQRRREKFSDPRNEPALPGAAEEFDGSGVWKSTDGGENWVPVNTGLPEARYRGRIGLDIARSNPETLYAFVDHYEIAHAAARGARDAYGRPRGEVIRGATVFRSDDGGASWRQTSEDGEFMESVSGTYGWVFGQIRVDPTDEDKIYLLGIRLNVSEDGGRSFRVLAGMHGDHHGLYIDPGNSDYLVNANDGGAYVSYDGGGNWRFFGDLPFVQFFNVAFDMGEPFRVYGSVQDHGSYSGVVDLSRGRHRIPAVTFREAPGGEGSRHQVDPTDPGIVYSTEFYGTLFRTDVSTGASRLIVPRPDPGEPPLRGQWLAPFVLSAHDPATIYHGMNFVFRSRDRGERWERISPDLSHANPELSGDIPFQTVSALAESPLSRGVLYAGTDDGRVHVTRNDGRVWTDVSDGLLPDRFVSSIVASAHERGRVYLTQNGRRSDDFGVYVWLSEDDGDTWRPVGRGIPVGPVNVVREDPRNADILYVGTDVGVYVSVDRGERWHVLGGDLPSTFVHDLQVHPRDDLLVAATHGRGMYVLDVRQLQRLDPSTRGSSVRVLDTEDGSLGAPARRGGPEEPRRYAYVHYWLAEDAEVLLEIRDGSGSVVRTLDTVGSAGLHMIEWDLDRTGDPAGGPRGAGDALVGAGDYTAVLTVGGVEQSLPLRVTGR